MGNPSEFNQELDVRELVRRTLSHEVLGLFTVLGFRLQDIEILNKNTNVSKHLQSIGNLADNLQDAVQAAADEIKNGNDDVSVIIRRHNLEAKIKSLRSRMQTLQSIADLGNSVAEPVILLQRLGLTMERMIMFSSELFQETPGDVLELVRLKKIFQDAVATVEPEDVHRVVLNDNGITLSYGYRYSLLSAIINLIRNALTYTEGDVEVTALVYDTSEVVKNYPRFQRIIKRAVSPRRQWCCISVRDYGRGIDSKLISKLFQPFVRIGPDGRIAESRDLQPTTPGKIHASQGVGLTIVRRVAERHKGVVIAQAASSHGMEFALILPNADSVR